MSRCVAAIEPVGKTRGARPRHEAIPAPGARPGAGRRAGLQAGSEVPSRKKRTIAAEASGPRGSV